MNIRIIPRLDIKGPNLVKGVHLEGLRILGKPESFAKHYYEEGADELIYMDVVASLYGRNSLLPIVERTSKEIFIPLTVGGGLRSIEDIRKVLIAGADKVSMNTAVIQRPELISEAAEKFGSSTIVISIEAKKQANGIYEAYTDNGRERTGVEVVQWAKRAAELGAGEILLTSIDREGTGKGFDLELIKSISQLVSIPVVASGGAGNFEDIAEVIDDGRADAVAIASILHYKYALDSRHLQADYSAEGNLDFLTNQRQNPRFKDVSLLEIKDYLKKKNINCRLTQPGATVNV